MVKLPKAYYPLVLLILIVALTGCELSRNSGEVSDLEPVSELAPTLAPLGSEEGEPTGEATPIPTVINVQPTATESPLEPGDAADNPAELVAPTSQAVDLVTSSEVGNSEAEEAAVVPETFTPPETESAAAGEAIIADATTDDLPDGGPIAANPPTSQTGDYGTSSYGDTTYTVQRGDTLFGIGLIYGLTPQAIMAANGLNSDIIQAGQVLAIPADNDVDYYPPANESDFYGGYGSEHIVAPGETLYRIALQYGSSVDAIAGANAIPYPYVIQTGQRLTIPAPDAYPGPPPPPAGGYYQPDPGYYPPQDPNQDYFPPNEGYYPPPNDNYLPGGANTHTVSPGETLYSIAQRYGLTADMIAMSNGLANPNQIYVGQVLYLP